MKLTARVRIPQAVSSRQVGEEMVMLDLANGTYYGLDPVGARMWQLLGEGKTLGEVCDLVTGEYEVTREVAERDLLTLVEDLVSHGLVVAD